MTDFPLFALTFTTLFPLINPVGTAIIVDPFFKGLAPGERWRDVSAVIFYCLILSLGTLWAGSWVLKFMGISVNVTQAAGGLLIARMGLDLLNSKPQEGEPTERNSDALFYPVAFPLTLGPGGISSLITLSAHAHAPDLEDTWWRMLVMSLAIFTLFAITFVCYGYSDRLIRKIGKKGSLVLNRLSAFIVFCIGIQMATNGFQSLFPELLR